MGGVRPPGQGRKARFARILNAIATDVDRALGSLDILAPLERDTLLHAWNDTARALPAATVPDLFALQVAANPDKVEQAKSKPAVVGWFVGQVMKSSGGKANPQTVNALLRQKLGV